MSKIRFVLQKMLTTKHKERQLIVKLINKWPLFLALNIGLAVGATSVNSLAKFRSISQSLQSISQSQSPTPHLPKSQPAIIGIGALGRIEPQGEVIHLSAPYALQGARVGQLLVSKGDKVRKGQVIAILDTYASHLASLKEAQMQVKVAQANLAKVKAGAKQGDINAQKATIARIEAELNNAQLDYQRYQSLYENGAISASQRDSKYLTLRTTQEQLAQAKASLKSIAEVRPTDVNVAQADVVKAIAAVKQAQEELELTNMRAPIDGQVLKIYTWPGEIVGNEGIVEIGQTKRMYVVAEVYQTDIKKVRIGQSATITSEAFTRQLRGTVTEIGLQVSKQNIFNINPKADTDRKIVEVKIRLNLADSQRVADLTNLQVQALIHL